MAAEPLAAKRPKPARKQVGNGVAEFAAALDSQTDECVLTLPRKVYTFDRLIRQDRE
jgi:hypothetical protein